MIPFFLFSRERGSFFLGLLVIGSCYFFPGKSFLRFIPCRSSPFLRVYVFPISLKEDQQVRRKTDLVLIEREPNRPTSKVPLRPIRPVPPLFFASKTIPAYFRANTFKGRGQRTLTRDVISTITRPLSININVGIRYVRCVTVSNGEVIHYRVSILIPVQAAGRSGNVQFCNAGHLSGLREM